MGLKRSRVVPVIPDETLFSESFRPGLGHSISSLVFRLWPEIFILNSEKRI